MNGYGNDCNMSENPPRFLVPATSTAMPLSPEPSEAPLLRAQIGEAYQGWLSKSPSRDTRSNYQRDIEQFLAFIGVSLDQMEHLCAIRPQHVSGWRDHLQAEGLTNSSIRRKMTAIRSLFSYLQHYGYTCKNPAHSDLAQAPSVPRDGKTVALSPDDCRRLLDAPILKITRQDKHGVKHEITVPAGIRDRALMGVLAYTGCRVGELVRLKVKSLQGKRRSSRAGDSRQGRQRAPGATASGSSRAAGSLAGHRWYPRQSRRSPLPAHESRLGPRPAGVFRESLEAPRRAEAR
jgi:integrase